MGAYYSTQATAGRRNEPIDKHGKLRVAYFKFTAAEAGADGSTVTLCRLPKGHIRILPQESRISVSAYGASRLMDIGHGAYVASDGKTAVAADADDFRNDLDVSSAQTNILLEANTLQREVYSFDGVDIIATVSGGTIPLAGTIEGYIVYIAE